ncbi:MAG TPA: hypothetical protein VJR46_04325 [Candidatus Dormibacteraeota bacterium]|nr:hypothetical protein [Candidatus Dormibacteraeota bacterium]
MSRALLALASTLLFAAIPVSAAADSLPSGEHAHGRVTIEPAYDDFNGSIVYLQTPDRLAPLNPTQPINNVNSHAVAPLFLVVYPPGTPGTFNCMGNPGNCPDHDGAIAGVATAVMPDVYGTNATAVPGHDHLVGLPRTGDFNVPWHVYVELFTSTSAVRHITTLGQLQAAWSSGDLVELDSGITFLCPVVSARAYASSAPV